MKAAGIAASDMELWIYRLESEERFTMSRRRIYNKSE